ncbi:hypothetical protein DM02DRAFT_654268 [Periconia macrospinosa]|uniref:Uncharacterized protein n=1 Tax=Periconia macrospinosa TaxID=97972 RepID=A0A2V1DU37_9PLEO|nr:hypothetical protein DM02DRAFT_654268 [Periconia macrospinosa]
MKGDPEFVILKYQSCLDASKFEEKILGSVVKGFLRPTDNYVPDAPLQYNKHELVEGSITDFVLDNDGTKTDEATLKLKSLGGVSFKGSTQSAIQLSGKFVRYKRLQQHDHFWPKLKEDKDVQMFVPRWTSRFRAPVCLVVGIMICEDVELSFEGEASIEREAGSDIQANVASNRQTVTIFKGKVGESRIFALELKKISTQGWITKDLVLKNEGPSVEATRLAADGESENEEDDDDERPKTEDLVLTELSKEEYEEVDA